MVPNPFQPRREFDEHKLQELADSIRMYGVLQPLTVTRKEVQREDGTFYSEYELIAGERRLRASKLAGVAQVPVIIREGEQSEQEKLELAIIENLQREDLNAVDRAIAFKQLTEQFGLSHSQVAQKMGRSREYVSNSIRLLALPEHMLNSLKHGDLSEGHARTLLMLSDRPEEQEVIYKEILLKKLSVREVERIVRKIATDKVRKKTLGEFDTTLIELEKKFTETLGTRVQIQKTDFGGKLTIDYFSEEDLEAILGRIKEDVAQAQDTTHAQAAHISSHTPLAIAANAPEPSPEPEAQISSESLEPESPDQTPAQEPSVAAVGTESLVSQSPIDQFAPTSVVSVPTPAVSEPQLSVPTPEPPPATPVTMLAEESIEPPALTDIVSPQPPVIAPPPTPEKTESDESNLYSINNFTV